MKILELREMINNTNNLINDVDLKVKQESTKINNENHHYNNNIIMQQSERNEDDKVEEIRNDILNLEDIKLEKKDENKGDNRFENDSNININEELEKKNIENNEPENISNINNTNNLNNLNSIQSSFKGKIIENSQTHISQKYQYLTITQTTLGLNSLMINKNFKSLIPCKENKVSIVKENIKKDIRFLAKENDFEIKNKININNNEKLKEDINNINLDSINNKVALKELEEKLELLLKNIRIKLGHESSDPYLEKILEKYSMLLLGKIEKLNMNK